MLGLIPSPQPTNIISGKRVSWKSILKSLFGFSCEDVGCVASGFLNKEDKCGSFMGGSQGVQAGWEAAGWEGATQGPPGALCLSADDKVLPSVDTQCLSLLDWKPRTSRTFVGTRVR